MEQNERLGILRKKLDLTLEKFGEKIGVTGSAVGNIEKGRRALTEQVVKSVVREFNVNEDWLRTGVGEMFIESKESHLSELAKQYALDDMEVKIVEAFLELSPDKRAAIKEYVSVLAKSFVEKSEEEIIQEKIDKEVEAYRRELEIEARVKEKSYLSDDTFEENENKKEAK
ncbi:helix-turn-helix transcriptional regulator [uncultured Anaerococcus sp.]|uniref:helix-turn-helix domain-containing protein n=1 Tax=uncultured Anaerococcus sp. TaxID=293428 RepID=UPI00280BBC60|nr:helix-turn-helix transcriptional regulator [uncultured Anaerococcus sp.]